MESAFSKSELETAHTYLKNLGVRAQLGIVLGSGLGHLTQEVKNARTIPYSEIPHMPSPTVVGHGGELVVGELAGTPVALLSGRAHLYEGHPPERSVFGVRLLALLGVERFLLTNAAGGIADELDVGSLMLITDHLNLTGRNPLVGRNEDALGPRFPDMTEAYDLEMREAFLKIASALGQPLHSGVYAGLLGPTYETPAEVRMLRTLGASAVGMSTVLETIALRHLGARVVGISCVTNRAAGLSNEKLSHAEVALAAKQVETAFARLVSEFAASLPKKT